MFQEYLQDQNKFLSDVGKATGKSTSDLANESRWVVTCFELLSLDQQVNALHTILVGILEYDQQRLASKSSVDRNIDKMSKAEKDTLSIGRGEGKISDVAFKNMIYDVIQAHGLNILDLVSGKVSKEDIENLENLKLTTAAKYAKQRRSLRKKIEAELAEENPNESEEDLNKLINQTLGVIHVHMALLNIFYDDEYLIATQGKIFTRSTPTQN